MKTASELPMDTLAAEFEVAFVQFDVSLHRVVDDVPVLGGDWTEADDALRAYCSKARQFSKEWQAGWYFVLSALEFFQRAPKRILYQGDATAHGSTIRLPAGTKLSEKPGGVRVFNAAKMVPATWGDPAEPDPDLWIGYMVNGGEGVDIEVAPHEFLEVDTSAVVLRANLESYGFADGSSIPVQVVDRGGLGGLVGLSLTAKGPSGQSYSSGRTIVFTNSFTNAHREEEMLPIVLCHELCHAFDNAHMCGNWDWHDVENRKSCCMCYWWEFVLDNESPRMPIAWTQNRQGSSFCGQHIRRMRDYHLQDNPGLGWGKR
jgi:hypothetical protein